MKLSIRIGLSIVGVVALFATALAIGVSVLPGADASSAGGFVYQATLPVAYAAGAGVRLAEVTLAAAPVVEPVVVEEAPLIIDHPGSSLAADAVVAKVPVFESPESSTPSRTLGNPTREGVPLVFLVKQRRGDWLKVQLPVRPNESTGWVRASDVSVRSVSNHIVVEVAKRKLSAFSGSQLLMETPVGVGTPKTPTPPGSFYVDISVKNPGGAYGRHMLSVAGFSNVLKSFGRGVGQVAIHGTNNPASVGQFSSNGCMRLSNEAVLQLAGLAPTGTPVFIVP